MFTEWELETIKQFVNELITLEEIKAECGTPIVVSIDFDKREVMVKGPRLGKILTAKSILQAANRKS